MAERSLRATPEGIQKAKKVVKHLGWTQTEVGEQVGTTRQPVGKFLGGKPIERPTFIDICRLLGLNWEEIAEPELEEQNQKNSIDIDALVQEVREKIKPDIQERCGTMRVLDMSQPIGLNDIYTNLNILEAITGRRRKGIAELLQECNAEDFERFGLGRITEERVPGLEAVKKYPKLMILGKPGAGKTTFLKYVAIQCIEGKFQAERVPIFLTLKDFAEATNKPPLAEYLNRQCSGCGVTVNQLADLFKQGRALVLLDGLDEVREEDNCRILQEIREFTGYYCDNRFVMTCRIAAREYVFEKFTEVEVADFDDKQIYTFATKWFKDKAVKPENFLKRLNENYRIYELATNPLLLTLLCLAFEESGDFPANRSELYKEGLDALLKKWDAKRGIYREQVYKKLSVQRKEDLLSKIALTTFEQGDYFFKQKVAEQYITEYIRNLPDANIDLEALQLDSELVLRSIEAQHGLLVERAKGIYSFSHLTFHEYFTAREIVFGKQSSDEALQNLANHITDYRWREVFLLAAGMSPSADRLLQLMRQQIDVIVTTDEKLQEFLSWVSQKSLLVEPHKPAGVWFSYLALALADVFDIAFDVARLLDCALDLTSEPGQTLHLTRVLDQALNLTHRITPYHARDLVRNLAHALRQAIEQLREQLPDPDKDREKFEEWCQDSTEAWSRELKAVAIQYRDISYAWQYNLKQVLKQYYDANLLLVECLNSDCYVSREVRQEIEDTLLLPIAEIENRKHR